MLFCCLFWDRISCCVPVYPWICDTPSSASKCWDYSCVPKSTLRRDKHIGYGFIMSVQELKHRDVRKKCLICNTVHINEHFNSSVIYNHLQVVVLINFSSEVEHCPALKSPLVGSITCILIPCPQTEKKYMKSLKCVFCHDNYIVGTVFVFWWWERMKKESQGILVGICFCFCWDWFSPPVRLVFRIENCLNLLLW